MSFFYLVTSRAEAESFKAAIPENLLTIDSSTPRGGKDEVVLSFDLEDAQKRTQLDEVLTHFDNPFADFDKKASLEALKRTLLARQLKDDSALFIWRTGALTQIEPSKDSAFIFIPKTTDTLTASLQVFVAQTNISTLSAADYGAYLTVCSYTNQPVIQNPVHYFSFQGRQSKIILNLEGNDPETGPITKEGKLSIGQKGFVTLRIDFSDKEKLHSVYKSLKHKYWENFTEKPFKSNRGTSLYGLLYNLACFFGEGESDEDNKDWFCLYNLFPTSLIASKASEFGLGQFVNSPLFPNELTKDDCKKLADFYISEKIFSRQDAIHVLGTDGLTLFEYLRGFIPLSDSNPLPATNSDLSLETPVESKPEPAPIEEITQELREETPSIEPPVIQPPSDQEPLTAAPDEMTEPESVEATDGLGFPLSFFPESFRQQVIDRLQANELLSQAIINLPEHAQKALFLLLFKDHIQANFISDFLNNPFFARKDVMIVEILERYLILYRFEVTNREEGFVTVFGKNDKIAIEKALDCYDKAITQLTQGKPAKLDLKFAKPRNKPNRPPSTDGDTKLLDKLAERNAVTSLFPPNWLEKIYQVLEDEEAVKVFKNLHPAAQQGVYLAHFVDGVMSPVLNAFLGNELISQEKIGVILKNYIRLFVYNSPNRNKKLFDGLTDSNASTVVKAIEKMALFAKHCMGYTGSRAGVASTSPLPTFTEKVDPPQFESKHFDSANDPNLDEAVTQMLIASESPDSLPVYPFPKMTLSPEDMQLFLSGGTSKIALLWKKLQEKNKNLPEKPVHLSLMIISDIFEKKEKIIGLRLFCKKTSFLTRGSVFYFEWDENSDPRLKEYSGNKKYAQHLMEDKRVILDDEPAPVIENKQETYVGEINPAPFLEAILTEGSLTDYVQELALAQKSAVSLESSKSFWIVDKSSEREEPFTHMALSGLPNLASKTGKYYFISSTHNGKTVTSLRYAQGRGSEQVVKCLLQNAEIQELPALVIACSYYGANLPEEASHLTIEDFLVFLKDTSRFNEIFSKFYQLGINSNGKKIDELYLVLDFQQKRVINVNFKFAISSNELDAKTTVIRMVKDKKDGFLFSEIINHHDRRRSNEETAPVKRKRLPKVKPPVEVQATDSRPAQFRISLDSILSKIDTFQKTIQSPEGAAPVMAPSFKNFHWKALLERYQSPQESNSKSTLAHVIARYTHLSAIILSLGKDRLGKMQIKQVKEIIEGLAHYLHSLGEDAWTLTEILFADEIYTLDLSNPFLTPSTSRYWGNEALASQQEAQALSKTADHGKAALAWRDATWHFMRAAHFQEAVDCYIQALDKFESAKLNPLIDEDVQFPDGVELFRYWGLAQLLRNTGAFRQCFQVYSMLYNQYGANTPEGLLVLEITGDYCVQAKLFEKAEVLFMQVVEGRKKLLETQAIAPEEVSTAVKKWRTIKGLKEKGGGFRSLNKGEDIFSYKPNLSTSRFLSNDPTVVSSAQIDRLQIDRPNSFEVGDMTSLPNILYKGQAALAISITPPQTAKRVMEQRATIQDNLDKTIQRTRSRSRYYKTGARFSAQTPLHHTKRATLQTFARRWSRSPVK